MKTEKEILIKIGKRIRELRIKKGFGNYEEFAWTNELSRSHYGKMETGTANFTMKSLLKILKVHDISIKKFFSEL